MRNYVDLIKGEDIDAPDVSEGELGYKIYVQEGAVLNERNEKAYVHYELKPTEKKLPKSVEDRMKVTKFMCDNFFDIRAFGGGHDHRSELRPGPRSHSDVLCRVG